MSTNTCEPYAILAGMNNNNSSYQDIDEIIAGNTPITSERKAQNIGIAVFKNDKLVR